MNSDPPSRPPIFTGHDDPAISDRGPLNYFALAALLVGLLAPLAMAAVELWIVPALGLLLAAVVLMQLSRNNNARGRGMALAGLALSVVFVVAAPTQHYVRRIRIVQQADAVGREWLTLILHDQLYQAYALQQQEARRPTLDRRLEEYYRKNSTQRLQFQTFANRKLVRTLVELGRQQTAEVPLLVRLYMNENIFQRGGSDVISNVYAVTYGGPQERQTFFVRLFLQRRDNPVKTSGFWQIENFSGPVTPGRI